MSFLEKAREPGHFKRSELAYNCWPELIAVVEAAREHVCSYADCEIERLCDALDAKADAS